MSRISVRPPFAQRKIDLAFAFEDAIEYIGVSTLLPYQEIRSGNIEYERAERTLM